jgi:Ca2+-transporting ATPase
MQGLTSRSAAELLARHGPNEAGKPRVRSFGAIVLATLREPMFLLLILAAGLYLVMGNLAEGLLLTVGAGISIALVVVEEARNESALAALRALAAPSARVFRDGQTLRIAARELVPGDIVLIGEGERVAADALLMAGDVLQADESILTGESVAVSKPPALAEPEGDYDPDPGGDDLPVVFSGTMIVRGQGVARVLRTGAATRLGRIGASLEDISHEPTLLQKTTTRLVGWLGLFAIGFCLLVAVVYGLVRGDWMEAALAAITLAISLVPEEFPMVLAVFLALGSWRLARGRVLARRPAVIETLGAASLLCVDKTGTLTLNRMSLTTLWRDGELVELAPSPTLTPAQARLLDLAARAAPRNPTDPLDRALIEAARAAGRPEPMGDILRSEPIRIDRPAYIEFWRMAEGDVLAAAKGAPEALLALCAADAAFAARVHDAVAEMAARGLRVLAVAARRSADDASTQPYAFEGLIAFLDPVREDVPEALAAARRAGVGVAMITGDYPATALEIARRAGIDVSAGTLTGAAISAIAPDELPARIRDVRVFARVRPEQKLQIVEAFKALGHVVAMTGDGVNDAPALEAAHIGVAMGKRGSDVAREASDIVLLDDSFPSIIAGIGLGRRIFTNLRKALTYITAIHAPVAGLALAPILAGLPPILFPAHVMVLELIIDPVCALVFEGEPLAKGAMDKPPRDPREALFGWRQIGFAALQGLVVLVAVFVIYYWALRSGQTDGQARATAFAALVAGNLTLALADASGGGAGEEGARRGAFWFIAAVTALVLAAALFVPPVAALFKFETPSATWIAAALIGALAAGGWPAVAARLRRL